MFCRILNKVTGKKSAIGVDSFEEFRQVVSTYDGLSSSLIITTDQDYEIDSEKGFISYVQQKDHEIHLSNAYMDDDLETQVHVRERTYCTLANVSIANSETQEPTPAIADEVEPGASNTRKCRFNVREIVANSGGTVEKVKELLDSLDNTPVMSDKSRLALNKIVGSNLFTNFGMKTNPDPEVLHDMAISITTHFEYTKCNGAKNWEMWYDADSNTGRLLKYVSRRRQATGVKRKYEKKSNSSKTVQTDLSTPDSASSELFMKNMAVTSSNKSSMIEAHQATFTVRRNFIITQEPLITTVLDRYPRFRDLTETFGIDFYEITGKKVDDFVRQWLQWEKGIKLMYSPSIQLEIDNLDSTSKKTEMIVANLNVLLPTVIRKKKQIDGNCGPVMDQLLQVYPASIPLERAVGEATGKLMKQPGLLLIGDSYFLKMETDAVKLDVGGLPDALAHLVASYYIFNCVYPENLKFVFGFFERVFDLSVEVRTVKRNVTISDFVMKVAAHVSNNDDML